MTWTSVCEFRELAVGMPVAVMVDGDAICVVRAGDDVFAVHDECTHAAVPLSEGEVDGATIECWMHVSKFDLRTGEALNLPATAPVRTYPVRVHDGHRIGVANLTPRTPRFPRPQPRNRSEGHVMQTASLTALVHQHLTAAREASSGRSAHTVYGGHEHTLRQTLIALASGHRLDEHESPGEATLQVLHGSVRLTEDGSAWDGSAGDLLVIPLGRHGLEALEDSVVLLTVAVQG